MFKHQVKLALHSIFKNKVNSIIISVVIAVGVSISITLLKSYDFMTSDPLPLKSEQLHHIQLDTWDLNSKVISVNGMPEKLTYLDAKFLSEIEGNRNTIISQSHAIVEKRTKDDFPYSLRLKATSDNFFQMFDVPFKYGNTWNEKVSKNGENKIVLSMDTNIRLFDGMNSVGENIWLNSKLFEVIGVLDFWQPKPNFLNLASKPFSSGKESYIPFKSLTVNEFPRSGDVQCLRSVQGKEYLDFLGSECTWLDFWVDLKDENEIKAYKKTLAGYIDVQKKLGRFEKPVSYNVYNLKKWINEHNLVGDEFSAILVLAFLILFLCIINSSSLLYFNFVSQNKTSRIRYYLGSSKKHIFIQYIVEAVIIGVLGCALALLLSMLGTKGLELLYGDEFLNISKLNLYQLVLTFGITFFAIVVSAIYPAIKVTRSCVR